MNRGVLPVFVLTVSFATFATSAGAADVDAGKKLFGKCRACHVIEEEKNSGGGPHLVGLFGRTAGTIEGFRYSDAMKESGLVWDEQTLFDFLYKPKEYIKGTRMNYRGLRKEKDRENLIAFLKEATAR